MFTLVRIWSVQCGDAALAAARVHTVILPLVTSSSSVHDFNIELQSIPDSTRLCLCSLVDWCLHVRRAVGRCGLACGLLECRCFSMTKDCNADLFFSCSEFQTTPHLAYKKSCFGEGFGPGSGFHKKFQVCSESQTIS